MAATEGSTPAAEEANEGVKRSADGPPPVEPPAKVVKAEEADDEEEKKAEQGDEKKDKTEKREKKDRKEKKEKTDKDKSEKKEKKEKKEKEGTSAKTKEGLTQQESAQKSALDHRKLFKMGQKFLTPPMADSTRAFYESLFHENPDSKIAIKFCVEYGLLPLEEHKRLLKKYNFLKEKGAFDMRTQIKRALEKKIKSQSKQDSKKDTKEKDKDRKDKEKSDKKERREATEKAAEGGEEGKAHDGS